MKEPAPLPFLALPGYRRRRLIEAIRMLPLAGLLVFLFPLLWPQSGETAVTTSRGAIYLFSGWFVLILGAAAGARALKRADRKDRRDTEQR